MNTRSRKTRFSFILPLVALLGASPVLADWDPEQEAIDAAERAENKRAEEARERELQRQRDKAQAEFDKMQMDGKRDYLGAAAIGKTDAEVNVLYDAKLKSDTAEAYQAAETARRAMSSGQGAAAVKQVTGKTLEELENMTDAEAEALAREMEEKYGQ